jgi:hypothetical protein
VAGFPETAYLQGLLVLAWTVLRLVQSRGSRLQFTQRVAVGGMAGLGLAAPQILAFFDYLPLSWLGSHDGQFAHAALIPQAIVPSLLAPYAYGTIFSHVDTWPTLIYVWSNIGGYVTALMLGLALYGFLIRRDAIAWLLLVCTTIALAKTFGIEPIVRLINLVPGITATAFYRYAPSLWELSVTILAAFGLHALASGEVHRTYRNVSFAFVVLAVAGVICGDLRLLDQFHADRAMRNTALASVGWLLVTAVVFVAALLSPSAKRRASWLALVLVADSALMYVVPTLANPKHGQLDTAAISFLQQNLGLQRFYTLGPIQANYGAQFGIASINHNYLPVERRWVEWVKANLDSGADPIVFNGNFPRDPGLPSQADSLRTHLSSYEWVGVKYVVTPPNADPFSLRVTSSLAVGNQAIPLMPGEAVSGQLGGGTITADALIDEVGVMQGNYSNTATGALELRICSSDDCTSGSADLTTSLDNTSLKIPLQRPLQLHKGQPVEYAFKHSGGNTPVALWGYPVSGGSAAQHLQLPGGAGNPVLGLALDLHVEAPATSQPKRVYRDDVMDIYALPEPKPYFDAVSGQCEVHPVSRTSTALDCTGPATLLRRELFFPGWTASVNGQVVEPAVYQDLFQSVSIPSGHSAVEFSYSPPHMMWAWLAFGLAALGLACPSVRRRPHHH